MNIDPKFILTRDEALALVPTLVAHTEAPKEEFDFQRWNKIREDMDETKVGQTVIVATRLTGETLIYVRAKVSMSKRGTVRNEDGPVIRVKAGKVSWRVDGCYLFVAVK